MQNNKTILLIMSALFIGGAEKQYRYIMEALAQKHRVHVLLLNQPLDGEELKTREYTNDHKNITFYQLNGDAINEAKLGKVCAKLGKIRSFIIQWIWLRRFIKNHTVDIVMFTYVTQLLMIPLFKKNNIYTIYNERNTGRQICDREFKIKLLRKCDKVICNSDYAAEYIKNRTGIDTDIYRNGIDIKPCQKRTHEGYHILVPARISRIKNQMLVVQAIEALKEFLSKEEISAIRTFFAGSCEFEDYKREIETEIKKNNSDIKLLGYVKCMDELYANSDLIILPSYEEGTPNVLLEAYMHKIDVLVSNIPMNVSCCTNEEMTFSPDDAEQLAEKIASCLRNRKSEEFFTSNFEYLIRNYGLDQMRQRYLSLIDHVME